MKRPQFYEGGAIDYPADIPYSIAKRTLTLADYLVERYKDVSALVDGVTMAPYEDAYTEHLLLEVPVFGKTKLALHSNSSGSVGVTLGPESQYNIWSSDYEDTNAGINFGIDDDYILLRPHGDVSSDELAKLWGAATALFVKVNLLNLRLWQPS